MVKDITKTLGQDLVHFFKECTHDKSPLRVDIYKDTDNNTPLSTVSVTCISNVEVLGGTPHFVVKIYADHNSDEILTINTALFKTVLKLDANTVLLKTDSLVFHIQKKTAISRV